MGMNLWLRLLALVLFRDRRRVGILETTRVRIRVWPNDLDLNRHVNNGRYLTLADLGRIDFFLRTGLMLEARRQAAYPIVGDAFAKFRRELRVFQTCEIQSRLVGWDDRWGFFEHRFLREGRVIGVVAIRGLFRNAQGPIKPGALFESLGAPEHSPPLPDWVQSWNSSAEELRGLLRLEEAQH